MNVSRRILGIDPGSRIMGYAIIEVELKRPKLIIMDILRLSGSDDHFDRMKEIFLKVSEIIKMFQPGEMAIESPFQGKNVQSMLKLGRAQGVAIAAGLQNGVSITEYAPRKIKQAITGKGEASKEEVAYMLQKIVGFESISGPLDATDGLAAAVCHFFQGNQTTSSTKIKDWKTFILKNPNRVK